MKWRTLRLSIALTGALLALSTGLDASPAVGNQPPLSKDHQASGQDHKPKSDPNHKSDHERQSLHHPRKPSWCIRAVEEEAHQQFQTDRLTFWHNVSTHDDLFGYQEKAHGWIKVRGGEHKGEKYGYLCTAEGDPPVGSVSIGPPYAPLAIPNHPIPVPSDPIPHPDSEL